MSTPTLPRSGGNGTGIGAEPVAARLDQVTKRFGAVVAVDTVDLEIRDGEFFSMLGPSGSGKTTLLRLIAGFEQPTAGRILLHGEDVTRRPPFDRDVNTVFQDYALFPHMSVAENVEYGLRVKKVPKRERAARADEAIAGVRLEGYAGRRPSQLSGGQRQRVALARALVNRPGILLLDEPLGALDRKLREDMQLELKAIQQEVGITFVFVTHDQGEALTMSDRIAVFSRGRIEQIGSPAEIYENPSTEFVAGFVGMSNFVSGEAAVALFGDPGPFTIRPEKIRLATPGTATREDGVAVAGVVRDVQYLGSDTRYHVDLELGGTLVVEQQNLTTTSTEALAAFGRSVELIFGREHARHILASAPASDQPGTIDTDSQLEEGTRP